MCEYKHEQKYRSIDAKHLSISGSLTTTNIIMLIGRERCGKGVVNRAVRMLASGSFASHFSSAFATVS
ncbi:hypothetical protein KIN20_016543 [Parelaphostrongylus tenuis]|uniref:Uncharacterized protein n=1 Tax=Parelaphostrongylus tenuis TaxID=148309 RepID=A0AAD5QN09_PARTN|nr:hypothetical protein KIN20_016543 [Parelaphostrongylus tenuis]